MSEHARQAQKDCEQKLIAENKKQKEENNRRVIVEVKIQDTQLNKFPKQRANFTKKENKNQESAKYKPPQNIEDERNYYSNQDEKQAPVQPIIKEPLAEQSPISDKAPKTPIEVLCKGFKMEQAERIANLKAKCEARHKRFSEQKQKDPMLTRKGTSRMYMHRNRSLMWCETPKAISTSWGRALFALEGRDTGDVNYVWVHLFMQERFEFLSPSSLTMHVFRNVPHFDTYRKLLFLRDPFTRLHSAYIDKIVQPFLQYHNLVESINRELKCNYLSIEHKCLQLMENADHRKSECRRLIHEHGTGVIIESPGLRETITNLLGFDPDPKAFDAQTCNKIHVPDCSSKTLLKGCHVNLTAVPSFAEFVQYILEAKDPKYSMDRHWSPVTLNCAPCSMPYTHILQLESMTRDVECTLREIYPSASYGKLVSPTHYGVVNGMVEVIRAPPSLNYDTPKEKHAHNKKPPPAIGTVGAVRPRDRDYKQDKARDILKQHYAQLSPTLMRNLWDFYRDDTELLDYPSEPDFGLNKFKALHSD